MFPPSQESYSLVQHEKVMQPLGNVRRHREKFTWNEGQLVCHRLRSFNKRTNEMSTLFDDPGGGTMEAMVVAGSEVDDAKEKGISGPDASSRGTSPRFESRARSHLSRDFDGFEQVLGGALGVHDRRVCCLAKAMSWTMGVLWSRVGAGSRVSGSLGTVVGGAN
jgi:hypothetical protein